MVDLFLVWLHAIIPFLVAACILTAPGLAVSWAWGVRSFRLAIAIFPVSAFLIGSGAVAAEFVHLPWNIWALIAWSGMWFIFGAGARRLWSQQYIPGENSEQVTVPIKTITIGVALSAIATIGASAYAMKSPFRPAQTWDAVFHLNAVRHIVDTGMGSTLTVGAAANSDGLPAFYPAGWHDFVALVASVSGDVVVATNVAAILIMAIVWPLGAALLTYAIAPALRFAPLAAALLAGASIAFPERVASYGTLWPVLYAYALVPFALAQLIWLLKGKSLSLNGGGLVLALLSVGGVAIAHPQGLLVLVMLGIWRILYLIIVMMTGRVRATVGARIALWGVLLGTVGGVGALWLSDLGRSVASWTWRPPTAYLPGEIWGVLSDSQLGTQGYGNSNPNYVLFIGLCVGVIFCAVKTSRIWMIPAWGSVTYLYLAVSTGSLPGAAIGALWYSDPVRIGASVPLIAVPLAALGWGELAARAFEALEKSERMSPAWLSAVTAGVLVFVIVCGTGGLSIRSSSSQLNINYRYSGKTGLNALVSDDELDMLRRLSDELPDDAVILGTPHSGAALAYAVGDISVVFPHFQGSRSDDTDLLAKHFDMLGSDPRVCDALGRNGIDYVYSDSILYELNPEQRLAYPGLNDIDSIDGLTPIDHGGTATLYEITACR